MNFVDLESFHRTTGESITIDFANVTKNQRWQGSFLEVDKSLTEEASKAIVNGNDVSDDDLEAFARTIGYGGGNYAFVSRLTVDRQDGQSCDADLTLTFKKPVCFWSLETCALSKNIYTFMWPGDKEEDINIRARRLRSWEQLKNDRRDNDYLSYRFYYYYMEGQSDSDKPDGDPISDVVYEAEEEFVSIQNGREVREVKTVTLHASLYELTKNDLKTAQKIMRGITSYDVYYPMVTCSRTQSMAFTDGQGELNHQMSIKSSSAFIWGNHELSKHSVEQLDNFLNAFKDFTFVKNGESQNQNGDGSYTKKEQWIGATNPDKDLYPPIGSQVYF